MSRLTLMLGLALAVAAAVAANIGLLSLSSGRHEPVGKLTPIADVRPASPAPAPPPSPQPTETTPSSHGTDDHTGGGAKDTHHADDDD